MQNIKKCCSSSTWSCLQTKHVLSSTGMHGSSSRMRGEADEELPLAFSLSRDTPNICCKFSHTCPDLLIRSGQVKNCFSSGERASGRKKSVVNSVYLKERHGAYCFSTLSCERYLRAALFGLNHSNRIVFFERVAVACVAGARK